MKFFIILLTIVLFIACSDDKSSTGPDYGFNENLVGEWYLLSYTDEDGLQDYEGTLVIEENKEVYGEMISEDGTETFQGNIATTDTDLKLTVTESNAYWIEEDTYHFEYHLQDDQLIIQGMINDENTTLQYANESPQADQFGTIAGYITDFNTNSPIENAHVQVYSSALESYTDYEGFFSITQVPVGSHQLQINKSGYESTVETVVVENNEISSVEIFLQQTTSGMGSISGFVVDAVNQVPISNALIEIIGTNFETQTNDEGIYFFNEIPIGSYDFKCTKTGFEEVIYTQETVLADEEIYLDFIMLPEGSVTVGTISGIITDFTNNNPIPNVLVQIVGLANTALSYDDGSYEISLIPAGTYDITFSKTGYDTYQETDVTIENGSEITLDVSLNAISGYSSLAAYVTNTLSIPISGVFVEIIGTDLTGTTGIGGICTIQNIPVGMYDVRFSKTGYVTQIFENTEFLSGIPRPLDVVLESSK